MASYTKFQWKPAAPKWASNPFNVAIIADKRLGSGSNYKGRRYLVVLGEVDTEDLRAHELLSSRAPCSRWVPACLALADQFVHAAGGNTDKDPAIAFANFNYFKTYDLSFDQRSMANQFAANRILELVKRLAITDVLVLGDEAATSIYGQILPELEPVKALKTRGRPREIEGVWWTNTISLSNVYSGASLSTDDEEGEEGETKIMQANLLGYVSRCTANFIIRDLVYKAETITPKPKLVDTIARFNQTFEHLWDTDVLAIDTETKNLNRVKNSVYSIQFAADYTAGYVIPVRHPDTCWTDSQITYIEKRMRQLFSKRLPPLETDLSRFTIWQNAKFDITVIRQWLQLHHLSPRVWDVMAGQYLLDENLKALADYRLLGVDRVSAYSLDSICASYGIDFYLDAEFSKHNRGEFGSRKLRDKNVLRYASMDVQVLHEIARLQQRQADNFLLNGESWGEAFKKLMLLQMTPIIYVESVMEHLGEHLDIPYMIELLDRGSDFQRAKQKLISDFRGFKSVQQVNKQLLTKDQQSQTDLFGETQWLFSVAKPAHKYKLFIETLGLEPLEYGKAGPKFDKKFQAHYGKDIPEVALFHKVSQVQTVESTYIKGFYKRVASDEDMAHDHCLRASYGFTGTVTGRSNSYDPNLQNVIQRGDFAPFIKRAFIAPRDFLILKLDYKAHEVRMLGLTALDDLLCGLFVLGRWFSKMYRQTGIPIFKKWMKTIGDIHRQNVAFFFQTTPELATEEQRDSVKSIVFGTIYGRGARAIATQAKAKVETIKALLVKFFQRFVKSDNWLKSTKKMAVTKGYTYSLIKRVRHMYAHLFGMDSLVAATERRGCNAPIQSIAADIGHVAAYLYHVHMLRVCRQWKLDDSGILRCGITSFVHDAIKTKAPHDYLLACVQVFQWCATYGAMQYYKEHFGLSFSVEIEVEIELAAHDGKHWKWDWHDGSVGDDGGGGLDYIIKKALLDQKAVYPDMDVKAAYRKVMALKKNTELIEWLDKEYPVLEDWPEARKVSKKIHDEYMAKSKEQPK